MNLTPNFETVVGDYMDWLEDTSRTQRPILSLRKMKILYGVKTTHTEITRQRAERRTPSAKAPKGSS